MYIIFALYSIYVHVIPDLYSIYVHVIFALYSLYVRIIFALYSLYVHVIPDLCSLYVHIIFGLLKNVPLTFLQPLSKQMIRKIVVHCHCPSLSTAIGCSVCLRPHLEHGRYQFACNNVVCSNPIFPCLMSTLSMCCISCKPLPAHAVLCALQK